MRLELISAHKILCGDLWDGVNMEMEEEYLEINLLNEWKIW